MPNYRPITKTVTATTLISTVINNIDISTSAWGIGLLNGTALDPSSHAIASGTVVIWEGANPTTAAPDHMTRTDATGKYAVTVKTGVILKIRYYGK